MFVCKNLEGVIVKRTLNIGTKSLAFLLTLVMVIGILPMSVFAEDHQVYDKYGRIIGYKQTGSIYSHLRLGDDTDDANSRQNQLKLTRDETKNMLQLLLTDDIKTILKK